MEQGRVPAHGLQRMPDRVAEVQRAPEVLLVRIPGDQRRLDGGGAGDEPLEQCVVAREHPLGVRVDELPVGRGGDDRLLDRLGQAGTQVAWRQRAQERHVGHDARGLMERAQEVLRHRVIGRDLAAERAVDLGEQRGRHVHVRQAAHVGARHPAAEVAHHAPAEAHEDVPATERARREPVPEADGLLHALARLAGGDRRDVDVAAAVAEHLEHRRAVQRLHGLVGDHPDRGVADQLLQPARGLRRRAGDVDGIGVMAVRPRDDVLAFARQVDRIADDVRADGVVAHRLLRSGSVERARPAGAAHRPDGPSCGRGGGVSRRGGAGRMP